MTKPRRSRRWATLEADTAAVLGGVRVVEDWTLFRQRPDALVDLPGGRRIVVDAKAYRKSAAHTLLDAVKKKYCQSENDIPLVVVKLPHQEAVAIIPLDFLAGLLKAKEPTP